MRRIFRNALAVSLLLLAVTVALMIVSFDRSISYLMLKPDSATIRAVYLDEYAVGYFRKRNDYFDTIPGQHRTVPSLPLSYTPGWNSGVPQASFAPNERHVFLGLSWAESNAISVVDASTSRTITIIKVEMTLWLPLVVFGILSGLLLVRSWHDRQAQRRREGRCLACGYDLAGNVSGVCPECGTPTSATRTSVKTP